MPFVDTAGTTQPVAGAAFLDVWLQGTSAVQLDAAQLIEHYPGPDRVSAGDTLVVTEVVDIDDFETNVHWTIGLTSQQPLTVTTLDAPGRLVIDITYKARGAPGVIGGSLPRSCTGLACPVYTGG